MGTNGLLQRKWFESGLDHRNHGCWLATCGTGESPDPYNGDFFFVGVFLGMGGDESAVKDVCDTNKYPLPSAR